MPIRKEKGIIPERECSEHDTILEKLKHPVI